MNEAYEKARQKILNSKVAETTALTLSFEKIGAIPPEITRLKKLEKLELHDTGIKDLNPIAGMTGLRSLTCGSNPIRDTTPLAQLVNLKYLSINHCRIKDISVVGNMKGLESLDVRDNHIGDIGMLRECKYLKYVDISNNLITTLRPLQHVLERDITLKTKGAFWVAFYGSVVMVKGCPLEDPPLTVADRGTRAVLNYWKVQDQKQAPPLSAGVVGRAPTVVTPVREEMRRLKEDVQDALVHNDFGKAFELLAKTGEDLSGWRGRWNALVRDSADGVISDADFRKEENLLRRALLEIVRNL